MGTSLENIINSIKLLISIEGNPECQPSTRNALCSKLERNVNKLLEFMQSNEKLKCSLDDVHLHAGALSDEDVPWYFVKWILKLLNLLSVELHMICEENEKALALQPSKSDGVPGDNLDALAPPLSANVLSLSQTKIVYAAFEFIFIFGVSPYLLPGVGIPVKHRSELAALMKEGGRSHELSQKDNSSHLTYCMNSLLTFLQDPDLANIILSKHVGDILAALLQLVCTKNIKASDASNCTVNSPSGPNYSEQPEHGKCEAASAMTLNCVTDRQLSTVCDCYAYEHILENFVERIPPAVLVRELLILQSGGLQQQVSKSVSAKPAKSPMWLKKACRSEIWKTVSKSEGILAVFTGILQNGDEADSRKCDAAARIVHDCFQGFCSMEQHYCCLAPQVLRLLTATSKGPFSRAANGIVVLMYSSQVELAERLVLKPLLLPLYICLGDEHDVVGVSKKANANSEIVSEAELTNCIEVIHRVFVLNCEPLSSIISCLKPLVNVLFDLYKFTRQSVSHLRDPLSDIMQRLLASQDVPTTVTYLHQLTFGGHASFRETSKQLRFVNGERGGVKANKVCDVTGDEDEDWTTSADAVVELIISLQQQQDKLVAEFFLWCLEELTKLISSEDMLDALSTPSCECVQSSLLDIDKRVAQAETTLKRNLLLLGTISALCERLEHQCLSNTTHIIQFVRVTLERAMKILTSAEDAVFSAFQNETLLMAMGLLTTIMTDEKLCKKLNWEDADCLLPFLKYFGESYSDVTVQQIAFNLQVAVATHGRVQVNDPNAVNQDCSSREVSDRNAAKQGDNSKVTNMKVSAGSKSSHSLIEVIGEKPASCSVTEAKEQVQSSTVSSAKSSFKDAMELMKDPLIPVQGHALICLRRLVETSDKEAIESSGMLFNLSLTHLTHDDSYIYLNAVQLLAATVIRFPSILLPRLIDEYLRQSSSDANQSELSAECRMKLGEVLVKASASLGLLVPHYRDLLVGSCLRAARDSDPLIRASALSNLGQVCQHLHFSLGSVMFEVFECVQALIKFDSVVEVRRSAAMCATLLLRGLSKDALKILGGDLMQNFYRMLKHVYTVEKDEVVRLHVQLAREEIDTFMKDFIFPQPNLIKRIHVIDPPDVD